MQFLEKQALISCIAKHFAIHQVKAELEILSGLSETLNVLALIREKYCRPLFSLKELSQVTTYYDLFQPRFSVNGNNVREEEAANKYWIELLREIYGQSEKV